MDLKNATGVGTSKFAKETYLVSLNSDTDELDINKLKTVLADFYELNGVVENDIVKKTSTRDLVKKIWLQHKNWQNWKEHYSSVVCL